MIAHSAVQSRYFVHKYLNNAPYNKSVSLIEKPCLAVTAGNVALSKTHYNRTFLTFLLISVSIWEITSEYSDSFMKKVKLPPRLEPIEMEDPPWSM